MTNMLIPDAALEQHTAILGRTGSGKTYTSKGIVERLLDMQRRVCIIDPTGVWWGLRSSADGKKPGYPVTVFGGDHADIPITEHSAKPLAELIGKGNVPCVIDLSLFLTGARQRFMTEFAQHLFRANPRIPLHLIIDEADDFLPQSAMKTENFMLGQMDRIVRRGRAKGFRVMMITQRPAALHKNALTQAGTLITMRMMGPQDRAAVQAWIKDQADPEQGKEVIASLPSLKLGEGWVWAPEQGVLERVKFPRIKTYDSSKSPDEGDVPPDAVRLADVDLDAVRAAFADQEQAVKANDPKELKKRIVELERKLKAANGALGTTDTVALEQARQEGVKTGAAQAGEEFQAYLSGLLIGLASRVKEQVDAAFDGVGVKPPPTVERPRPATVERPRPVSESRPPSRANGSGDADIAPRHQKILDAIAWYSSFGMEQPTRVQVAFYAGQAPKGGSFNNNLGALRTAGLIDYPQPGHITLTDEGWAQAEDPGEPATAEELQQRVYDQLRRPALVRIAQALIETWPDQLTKADLAERVEQSANGGSFNNNLGRLRSLGLIDYPIPGHAKAEDFLFLQ